MLAKARQILSSELALAKEIDEEAAERLLDDVLAEGMPAAEEPEAEKAVEPEAS
jgi:CarD family transcriptional regulator